MLSLGCKPPPGPRVKPSGTYVIGSVHLYDERGNLLSDPANVSIHVTGPGVDKTAVTNSQGDFRVNDLPWGKYILRFSRSDIGTYFAGTELVYDNLNPYAPYDFKVLQMSQLSTTVVSSIKKTSDSFNGENGVSFDLGFATPPDYGHPSYYRVFVDTTPNVSVDHYIAYSNARSAIADPSSWGFSFSDVAWYALTPGHTYYLTVYGDAATNNLNADSIGHYFFPCISKSHPDPISFSR